MMIGILGKKIGMTQVFNEKGKLIPVTAIQAGPCTILAVKDRSVQLGFDSIDEKRLKKPLLGYFKKLKVPACKFIREVVRDPKEEIKVGDTVKVDIFQAGEYVDVAGISVGKGFQGGMKRWKWSGGPQTHGSMSHRRIGSMGSSTTPGRVWKGQHLPGHMGRERVSCVNLQVTQVIPEENILLIKGSVPGNKNGYLVVRRAKKKTKAA
jgi:large subunit ribosomal protein L3